MRRILFAACAAAAVLATPVSATTFPSLTTIYVISGVVNSADAADAGLATAFQCSNVSGVTTSIRFLVLSRTGTVLASSTATNVAHGATIARSTHPTNSYGGEGTGLIAGTALNAGVVNIESLQSGVFCTAAIIDASLNNPDGVSPHIIRVNEHPGTVE
jgi:hypothetical protein